LGQDKNLGQYNLPNGSGCIQACCDELNSSWGSTLISPELFWRHHMRKIATLAAVGVLALGALSTSGAEARSGRRGAAIAAGAVGLAAGAIIAGAASQAYAAPTYGYGAPAYGYAAPVTSYRYDDGYYAQPVYRERRVVRYYEEPRPVYRTRRVVRSYDYGYAPRSPYYGSGYYGGW
jgi:hypothetical protein